MDMEQLNYTYIFGDIDNTPRNVTVIEHHKNESHQFQVSVNDSNFLSTVNAQLSSELADVVDLAVAVSITDRSSFRKENTRTRIHIVLPVRHPEMFARPEIEEWLYKTLCWFTNDYWSFEFKHRVAPDRLTVSQLRMPLADDGVERPVEVALWSGGLDSLAGLCNRLIAKPSGNFTIFGTGGNEQVFSIQRKVAERVNTKLPNRIKLVQVPIRSCKTNSLKKNYRPNARGFVFTLLGAVCALLEGQQTLHVYENGVGAINLPFSESAVGLDHLRPVHPLSLRYMRKLISQLLGVPFTFHNPFLFQTKAQMCRVFIDTDTTDLISHTITCNRPHRLPGVPQCGACAACLLRKQALAVQGIEDQTEYVVPHHKALDPSDSEYLKHILFHVQDLQLLLEKPNPWKEISCSKYFQLAEIANEIAESEGIASKNLQDWLIQLYRNYIEEWNAVKDIVEQNLCSIPEKRVNTFEEAQYKLF